VLEAHVCRVKVKFKAKKIKQTGTISSSHWLKCELRGIKIVQNVNFLGIFKSTQLKPLTRIRKVVFSLSSLAASHERLTSGISNREPELYPNILVSFSGLTTSQQGPTKPGNPV